MEFEQTGQVGKDQSAAAKPATLQPLAYSVEQACAVSSLKRTTIFELIRTKQLSVARIGRRTLVLADSLQELLRSRTA